jgi:DNA-binding NtrC family response regulator
MGRKLLIIDDKVKLCRSLSLSFTDLGYECCYATNSQDAIKLLAEYDIKVAILDLSLGEENGIEVLKRLLKIDERLSVIMITGYGTVKTAVEAIQFGALDFIEKPLDFDKLQAQVEKAFRLSSINEENKSLRGRIERLGSRLITQDPGLLETLGRARQLAATELPILIQGESGTGKELLAEYVHNCSSRSAKDMLQVNCAAFPDSLLDDELFGHEKGAFTGADKSFAGVFERADGTSLHLDEIGDMGLPTQAKILRSLQNKQIRRIGGSDTVEVDVRFIASTNKNLKLLINDKVFREDLYFRLNAAVLTISPLRERAGDIPLLCRHFLSEFGSGKDLSDECLEILMSHPWPGNVRELRNCMNYAAAISGVSRRIEVKHLPSDFAPEVAGLGQLPKSLEDAEKQQILRVLAEVENNKKKAAEILNISRNTLYNKLTKYGIA